jgi:hypothetical protein
MDKDGALPNINQCQQPLLRFYVPCGFPNWCKPNGKSLEDFSKVTIDDLRAEDLLIYHYDTARVNMSHPQSKKLRNLLPDEGLSLFTASLIDQ